MKKVIGIAIALALVTPTLAAQGLFKKLLQNTQAPNQSANAPSASQVITLPTVMFWGQMMSADTNVSQQVAQYARQHNLRQLPGDYAHLLVNTATLNGVIVYTASPDDILCGAPAGAVALVSGKMANKDDVTSLPEFQAYQAQQDALKKNAQAVSAQSTQQQEQLLRDSQDGYESKLQKDVASEYQRQLNQSILQNTTKPSAQSVMIKYASLINSGFAKMSMQDRCVWAMGVFVAQNASNLDGSIAAARNRAAAQTQSSSLGFDGPAQPQSTLPFDPTVAMNTLKVATSLQHQAFQLGSGAASTTDASATSSGTNAGSALKSY